MQEGTKMISSLGAVRPREIRYGPPIEVILDIGQGGRAAGVRPRAANKSLRAD